MSVEFIWRLPTSGDGKYGNALKERRGERASADHPYSEGVTDPRGQSFNYFDYLHQVSRAADLAGFDGLVIPQDSNGDEPWIVSGYVARGTKHLKLITEFESNWGSAVYAAKNAVTFQRYTGGRVAWQLSKGSEQGRNSVGDSIEEKEITNRIDEFLTVAKGVIGNPPFTFKGKYFEVLNGGFQGAIGNQKVPEVYLSGNSNDDFILSARFADVHILDALPLVKIREEIAAFNTFTKVSKRKVNIGIRLDIIARETEDEAIFDATRYWEQVNQNSKIKPVEKVVNGHLWHNLTTSNSGAKTTIVGSYQQVAEALVDYHKLGVQTFQLSAIPHLEEAYRVGEHILPLVRKQISPDHRRAA